jgi:hypothetical protein
MTGGFDRLIRRGLDVPASDDEPEPEPVGDVGIGRGAGSAPTPSRPPTISDEIRLAADVVRGRIPFADLVARR